MTTLYCSPAEPGGFPVMLVVIWNGYHWLIIEGPWW
jgi:hypothetical protein